MNILSSLLIIIFLVGCTTSKYSTVNIEKFDYQKPAEILLDITSKTSQSNKHEAAKVFLEMSKTRSLGSKSQLLNKIKTLTDDNL